MKRLTSPIDGPAAARFEQEFQTLVTACADLDQGDRHIALLHLFRSTGAAFHVVERLQIADLDLARARVTLDELGSQHEPSARRIGFLDPQAVQSLCSFFSRQPRTSGAAFRAHSGQVETPLTEDGIQSLFWHLTKRAHLTLQFTPALFRSALIWRLKSHGASAFDIACIVGFNKPVDAAHLDALQSVFARC